jgi:RNA polymerase sigma factor (TIGR02999 family)
MSEVTRILSTLASGDRASARDLLPLVYDELRKLAQARLAREAPGQTLQATALVHEAYLRLLGDHEPGNWDGRAHFFGAAAEAMRRILIEQARHKQSVKRGGGQARAALDAVEIAAPDPGVDLLEIHDALDRFEQIDPAKAQLVKLRYFIGLTLPEAAEVLGISVTTADRHWAYARAWLHAALAVSPPRADNSTNS